MNREDQAEAIELLLAIAPIVIGALHRKNMLRPKEKTALQNVLRDCHAVPEVTRRIALALEETVLEREEKRETPRQR